MIKSPNEADLQEAAGNSSRDDQANKFSTKANDLSRPSTPWLRLKDPRIVRVSRAFGGKDRHSKVCTVKGLRDRRVRLSVPTAIQLYDLQERLGLNQPSKVVDWLLDAAKHEIDELPPLPLPPSGNFGLNHPSLVLTSSHGVQTHAHAQLSHDNGEGPSGGIAPARSHFWSTNSDAIWRGKSKEIARDTTNEEEEENQKDISTGSDQKEEGTVDGNSSSNNFLTRISTNHPFFPGLVNNAMPYAYHNWDHNQPSNFPLSQLASHGFPSQTADLHNFINVVSLPSTLSLSTTQSYFPSHNAAAAAEIDPRQFNHMHMLSSSSTSQNLLPNSLSPTLYPNSQTLRTPHLSMMTKLVRSSNNTTGSDHHQPNTDQESPSR